MANVPHIVHTRKMREKKTARTATHTRDIYIIYALLWLI